MEKIIEFSIGTSPVNVKIQNIRSLDISKTFNCGQSFRFEPVSVFGNKVEYIGVAFNRCVVFAQNCDTELTIYGSDKEEYEKIWRKYLSLDVDYSKSDSEIAEASDSVHLQTAVKFGKGLRILRQDPWESICSFIVSQNNNIPRIKKIIASMCEKYGEPIHFLGNTYYSFPTAGSLYKAGIDEIFALKTGFRAKYIWDASKKVCLNEIDFEKIRKESLNEGIADLCRINGVGLKVASCALLFGFEKGDAFPVDVWIKRVLSKYFPNGIDLNALGKNAGLAQQYLFYYEKNLPVS